MKSPKPATDNSLNEHFALLQILSLIFCGIVVAILKMETGRNCSMSGINSGHYYLPTYQILMISDNVEFVRYCGVHFENGGRQKFFNVGNQFGNHYLPTYQILMTSDNVEFLRYCGDHFENSGR